MQNSVRVSGALPQVPLAMDLDGWAGEAEACSMADAGYRMRGDARPTQPLRQHLPDRPANRLVPGLQTHAQGDRRLADADGGGEAGDVAGAGGAVRGRWGGGILTVRLRGWNGNQLPFRMIIRRAAKYYCG